MDNWNYAWFDIPSLNPYSIVIEGSMKGGSLNDIAIDDLNIAKGQCDDKVPSNKCNFNNGLCRYTNDIIDGHIDWLLHSGFYDDEDDFPNKERETFIYLHTRQDADVANSGSIYSPSFEFTGHICVDFLAYFHGDIGKLSLLTIQFINGEEQDDEIYKIDKDMGEHWQRRSISTEITEKEFGIAFTGEFNSGVKNKTMGVDRIYITQGPCSTPGDCDFENSDMCSYYNGPNNDFNWMTGTGNDDSDSWSRPDVDHTMGNETGGFLFVDPSTFPENAMASVITSFMEEFTKTKCVAFWFHMYGNNIGDLSVIFNSICDTVYVLWNSNDSLNITQGEWQYGSVPYRSLTPYQLGFLAVSGNGTEGDIALDDILILDDPCEVQPPGADANANFTNPTTTPNRNKTTTALPTTSSPPVEDAYSCNFTINLCRWQQDADNKVDWMVTDGNAHVSFYHLNPNERSRLISYPVSATEGNCLVLEYGNLGLNPGDFNIWVQHVDNSSLSRKFFHTTDMVKKYMELKVNLNYNVDFQIVLEAVKREKVSGSLHVTSVKLLDEACPQDPKICTFEDSQMCNYQNDKNGETVKGEWLWASGNTNNGTAPNEDHTTDSISGHYVYVNGNYPGYGNNTKAVLISQAFKADDASCLSFWYTIESDRDENLKVYQSINGRDEDELIWARKNTYLDRWEMATAQLTQNSEYHIKFEALLAQPGNAYIAIDDVSIAGSACDPPGTCHFNRTMCSWVNSKVDDFDWSFSDLGLSAPSSTEPGYRARLESISFEANAMQCVVFDYLLIGELQGCLWFSMFYRNEAIDLWKLCGQNGNHWLRGQFAVPSTNDSFYIFIDAIIGDNHVLPIRIKELTTTGEEGCTILPPEADPTATTPSPQTTTTSWNPPTTSENMDLPEDCDFEQGFCEWEAFIPPDTRGL